MTIGQTIARLRKERGLTQEQLAERLPFPAASQACVWGRRDWVRHEMQRTLFATKTPCRSKQSGKGFAQIV